MKIKQVLLNRRKRCFEVEIGKQNYAFPYSKLPVKPSLRNPIVGITVDKETGHETFTYQLYSGAEATVPLDAVLEYNQDQDYLRGMILYKLSVQAEKLIAKKSIPKREIIRRLKTSPTQFYRLLNPTYKNKTIDQMVKLLCALDCEVDLIFTPRVAA